MQDLGGEHRESLDSITLTDSGSRPRTIDDYVDQARQRLGLDSDRQLGFRLGFKGTPVSHWRRKRAWPAEDTMVQLADICGIDAAAAILDLKRWSATERTQLVWARIADKVKRTAAAAILGAALIPGLAGAAIPQLEQGGNRVTLKDAGVYIMENHRRRRRFNRLASFVKALQRLAGFSSSRGSMPAPAPSRAAAMLPLGA